MRVRLGAVGRSDRLVGAAYRPGGQRGAMRDERCGHDCEKEGGDPPGQALHVQGLADRIGQGEGDDLSGRPKPRAETPNGRPRKGARPAVLSAGGEVPAGP